ncbi:MAG: hypothetical protein HXY25_05910 [Alphaproteobacteria bacterium]|nr:hypothetical protein [Alphaproteobacteria bacterium]
MPRPADPVTDLFATRLYRAPLGGKGTQTLRADLEKTILMLAREDGAGRAWSAANGYPGYTSYASLDDLAWRAPPVAELERRLEPHVARFATTLAFDLQGAPLTLDSLWVNLLEPGGTHSGHIHPHAVVSGTYYVSVPEGAGALRLEDPRLPLMMAAPPRRARAPQALQPFLYLQPRAGTVVLWESWLRHEVTAGTARAPRLSISFNYRWGR